MKVRIPVVLNSRGDWNAAGSSFCSVELCIDAAYEGMPPDGKGERLVFITADIPEIKEVEGTVDCN